jgi:hypothetical protein
MFKYVLKAGILFASISLACSGALAQEVVHALAGTVTSVDPAAKTITVITDDGSEGTFKDLTDSKTSIEFDKALRAGSTPAAAFKSGRARVVVFYFGDAAVRTAVALKDLGAGPFTVTTGTVVKYEKKQHSFSVKTDAGKDETFETAPATVADNGSGAIEGPKFEADKGNQVRIVSASMNGAPTALFIIVLATS